MEVKTDTSTCVLFPSRYSLLPIWHFFATCHSRLPFVQHATADQRFHVPDIFATDLVGDRPDAGGARHCVPPEKQVVAGADQAGVEQHRIDIAELAAFDAFRATGGGEKK